MDKHPHPVLLTRFGRGRLQRRKSREVVRHLLTDCEDCRRVTSDLLPPAVVGEDVQAGGEAQGTEYGPAFERAGQAVERMRPVLAAERAAAPGLMRELLAHPLDRQREEVAADGSRYHTWGFCALLLDTAREWGFQDPGRALELARLGVEIAERLDARVYGPARVSDMAARAWAALGGAQRIRGDFHDAEASFASAEQRLKNGTGDLVEKAHVLLLKASLRGNQQRFREALQLLDRVMSLGRRCEDDHLCGKALIMRGFLLGVANDPEAAIRHLTEGLAKVDPESDPRLVIVAQHNLTLYLAEGGRYREAMRLLESARPLYHQVGDQMNLLRLRWVEGKIASALGHFSEAEELLRGVQAELIECELGYDAALLSLDLATIYASQGRGAEMRRLAEEMIPIFKSRDIHREAIAALFVFQKAAEMERVTLGLIRDVTSYLKESRAASSLRSRELR
ncbi:MAG TPA: tetratricopeptide repeat protein [Thermoanaerobaculia bacterium]|nr:tetratricopeptide repeat protein [Thermoanaerobaculia bacterium]